MGDSRSWKINNNIQHQKIYDIRFILLFIFGIVTCVTLSEIQNTHHKENKCSTIRVIPLSERSCLYYFGYWRFYCVCFIALAHPLIVRIIPIRQLCKIERFSQIVFPKSAKEVSDLSRLRHLESDSFLCRSNAGCFVCVYIHMYQF